MQPGPTHGMPRASLHKTGRHSIADASSSTFTALPAPHRMALLSVLCCARFLKGRHSTSSSTAVIPEAVTGVSWHSPDKVEVAVADASHRQRRSASRFRNPGGALVGEERQARSRTVGIEGGG